MAEAFRVVNKKKEISLKTGDLFTIEFDNLAKGVASFIPHKGGVADKGSAIHIDLQPLGYGKDQEESKGILAHIVGQILGWNIRSVYVR